MARDRRGRRPTDPTPDPDPTAADADLISTATADSISAVIWDLDGTVIDTETLVLEVARTIVERHGKQLTKEAAVKAVGMRPLEAWQAVAEELGMDGISAEQLFHESEPLLVARWHEAPLLPGVLRLLAHLRTAGVPMALATSSSRITLERKLSSKPEVAEAFSLRVCGDECCQGKPHPECFVEAARRLGVAPAECLVIEDAPSGIEAATAAGMRVVAVPSVLAKDGTLPRVYPTPDPAAVAGCVAVLPSLYDFQPQLFGLPPFADVVAGSAVPMDVVWRIRGIVVAGFGRGSRELGIPTANLDADSLRGTLSQAVTGIYAGWASVGSSPAVHKMCMSVGWNPVFKNKEKTAEPWILHDFGRDFHGEEIRLLVCAWLRPEAEFVSVQALVEQIHRDADVTRAALEVEPLSGYRADPFLRPGNGTDGKAS